MKIPIHHVELNDSRGSINLKQAERNSVVWFLLCLLVFLFLLFRLRLVSKNDSVKPFRLLENLLALNRNTGYCLGKLFIETCAQFALNHEDFQKKRGECLGVQHPSDQIIINFIKKLVDRRLWQLNQKPKVLYYLCNYVVRSIWKISSFKLNLSVES